MTLLSLSAQQPKTPLYLFSFPSLGTGLASFLLTAATKVTDDSSSVLPNGESVSFYCFMLAAAEEDIAGLLSWVYFDNGFITDCGTVTGSQLWLHMQDGGVPLFTSMYPGQYHKRLTA